MFKKLEREDLVSGNDTQSSPNDTDISDKLTDVDEEAELNGMKVFQVWLNKGKKVSLQCFINYGDLLVDTFYFTNITENDSRGLWHFNFLKIMEVHKEVKEHFNVCEKFL